MYWAARQSSVTTSCDTRLMSSQARSAHCLALAAALVSVGAGSVLYRSHGLFTVTLIMTGAVSVIVKGPWLLNPHAIHPPTHPPPFLSRSCVSCHIVPIATQTM